MALIHTIRHPARIQDIRFLPSVADPTTELLLVSAEDKKVSVYRPVGESENSAGAVKEGGISEAQVDDHLVSGSGTEAETRLEAEAEAEAECSYSLVAEFVGHISRCVATVSACSLPSPC